MIDHAQVLGLVPGEVPFNRGDPAKHMIMRAGRTTFAVQLPLEP